MTEDEAQRPKPPVPRRGAGRVFSPVVAILAFIYFLIDALFLPPLRLLGRWLGVFNLSARRGEGIRPLGPYQPLALFLVPLILLEPVKPTAAYLAAKRRYTHSIGVLVSGELLKVTIDRKSV